MGGNLVIYIVLWDKKYILLLWVNGPYYSNPLNALGSVCQKMP